MQLQARGLGGRFGAQQLRAQHLQRSAVVISAKKKAGNKKGSNKGGGGGGEQGGSAAGVKEAPRATKMQYADPEIRGILFSLITSYQKQVGTFLVDDIELDDLADIIYKAPFGCVAHDRNAEEEEEPIFTYANRAALELWDTNWDGIVGIPSASSPGGFDAGPDDWRESKSGRKFKTLETKTIKINDWGGACIGEALLFWKFELENGTQGACEGENMLAAAEEIARMKLPASPEEIEAAEKAVADQGLRVRKLKEEDGMTNQDPEVQDAVAELLHLKSVVEDLKKRGTEST